MSLMHVFEVILLAAIVAGIFVGWKEPVKYQSRRTETHPADQQPAVR